MRVEVSLGPAPVSTQEAIAAVARNTDGFDPQLAQVAAEGVDLGTDFLVECTKLGELVFQPVARTVVDPGDQQNALSRDAPKLGKTACLVLPVMQREDGHRDVEAVVGKG